MKNIKFILLSFLIWRLLLFIPIILAEKFISFRQGYFYTSILGSVQPESPIRNFLIYSWANFDGFHYLLLAGNGYTNNFGFYPFFPLMIRIVSSLFGSTEPFKLIQLISGLFISNLSFLVALFMFRRLLKLDYSDKIANGVILLLLIFPTSFFFASVYSESLFFLLLVSSLFFARKKKWILAGLTGMLLAVTRIVGIFILPVLIYEFIKEENIIKKWSKINVKGKLKLLIKSLPLFITPIGLVGYIYYNWLKTNDILYFLNAHGKYGNGRSINTLVSLPQTLFRYLKIFFGVSPFQYEWWIAFFEFTIFFISIILLYVAWKKKIRFSYILFSVFCFVLPASSGSFNSLPRYSLILFPIYIALILIPSKLIKIVYIAVSPILLFLLLMLFSKGYFVA